MAPNTIKPEISVIIPIHNGEKWIDKCFESIVIQTVLPSMRLEIAVCDDASTDGTSTILEAWKEKLNNFSISLKIFKNNSEHPKGVGYAKNRAVEISTGEYLCFQDIDDVMLPRRIEVQYKIALENQSAVCIKLKYALNKTFDIQRHDRSISHRNLTKIRIQKIIGGRFRRKPENSTERFVRWANNLNKDQLQIQIYTSHGPTIIMPTWFCHRNVFNNVEGGFSEKGRGTPEDLIFFYSHLDNNGRILRADEVILEYLYHPGATTFSIQQKTIFEIRVARLEEKVLSKWPTFTIWNAGKQGRQLFRSLSYHFQKKVVALCDVDEKKIGRKYTPYDASKRKAKDAIPILHFSDARPPFIICVKLDMTNGVFENNLKSLNLKEGLDYVLFN